MNLIPVNEISEELKALIEESTKTLKNNEYVLYRRSDIKTIDYYLEDGTDPSKLQRNQEIVGASMTFTSAYYFITDPFWKDEKTGKVEPRQVKIGYVVGNTGNTEDPYKFGKVEFLKEQGGIIRIDTATPNYKGLLLYFALHPCNIDNPLIKLGHLQYPKLNGMIFQRLSVEDNIQKLAERKQKVAGINAKIWGATDEEIREFVACLPDEFKPYTHESDIAALRLKLEEKAVNTDWFESNWGKNVNGVILFIEKCKQKGTLKYENDSWFLVNKGTPTLLPVKISEFTDETTALLEYFNTKDGEKAKKVLESLTNK